MLSPVVLHIVSPFTIVNNVLVGLGFITFGLMPRLRARMRPPALHERRNGG